MSIKMETQGGTNSNERAALNSTELRAFAKRNAQAEIRLLSRRAAR